MPGGRARVRVAASWSQFVRRAPGGPASTGGYNNSREYRSRMGGSGAPDGLAPDGPGPATTTGAERLHSTARVSWCSRPAIAGRPCKYGRALCIPHIRGTGGKSLHTGSMRLPCGGPLCAGRHKSRNCSAQQAPGRQCGRQPPRCEHHIGPFAAALRASPAPTITGSGLGGLHRGGRASPAGCRCSQCSGCVGQQRTLSVPAKHRRNQQSTPPSTDDVRVSFFLTYEYIHAYDDRGTLLTEYENGAADRESPPRRSSPSSWRGTNSFWPWS